MDNSGFWAGFVAGFLAAGVLGFVLQQLRFQHKKIGALSRPQEVKLEIEKTPGQVAMGSASGACGCFFWTVVLIAVLFGFMWLTFQTLQ